MEAHGTTRCQGALGLVVPDGRTGGSQSESVQSLLENGKGNTCLYPLLLPGRILCGRDVKQYSLCQGVLVLELVEGGTLPPVGLGSPSCCRLATQFIASAKQSLGARLLMAGFGRNDSISY